MRKTSREVAVTLTDLELRFGLSIDIWDFDNRRVHALAKIAKRLTGNRVRPLHLWRHFSRAVATSAFKAKNRSDYSKLYRGTQDKLKAELGRMPQPCEVFIRIYDDSVGTMLGRDAKDTARHNGTY